MTLTLMVLIVGAAACFVSGAEQAPADVNAPQTLQEYLTYAALHNAALKAAFEEWKAALERIPQAQALPDPTFTYSRFIEEIETRQQMGVMQMFPWFGKIEARTDAAAATAKAAHRRYEARKLQLFFEVKGAFYEYVYLARAIRISQENVRLMEHFEEVARAKYTAAAAGHPDIIRAQIQVADLQNEQVSLERLRVPTVARLNAALNRPGEATLPWPRAEAVRPVEVDRQTLIAALRENNPQLQAMGFEVERLTHEAELAKRSFYPDIGLGVERMDMLMGDDDEVIIGLEMNLPIWRRNYKAGESQARAMARRAQYEKRDLENTLSARAERALYEFEDSGRRVCLYGDTLVPKAEELIGASEAAYMAGTVDFLMLTDAQRTLLQYQLERERAWANQQQRLAEIEMLIGASLSQSDPPRPED